MALMDRQLLCETLILHLMVRAMQLKEALPWNCCASHHHQELVRFLRLDHFKDLLQVCYFVKPTAPSPTLRAGDTWPLATPEICRHVCAQHPLGPARPSAVKVTALLLGKFFHTIRAQTHFDWAHDDRGCSLPSYFKRFIHLTDGCWQFWAQITLLLFLNKQTMKSSVWKKCYVSCNYYFQAARVTVRAITSNAPGQK